MDLSPKQLAESHYAVTHLPEVARSRIAISLEAVLPNLVSDLPRQSAGFIASFRRVNDGACILGISELRSLKKLGMALSGFVLRCRELALRWQSFEIACNELLGVWSPPADLRFPTETSRYTRPAFRQHLASLDLPDAQSLWLNDQVFALMIGLENVERLAIGVSVPRSVHERTLVWLTQIAEEFRLLVLPALTGEDGLLKGLPAVQAEITRRIYQEDLKR